jgi:hypothetical protein
LQEAASTKTSKGAKKAKKGAAREEKASFAADRLAKMGLWGFAFYGPFQVYHHRIS